MEQVKVANMLKAMGVKKQPRRYSKSFLLTHTYLECPIHQLPDEDELSSFYENSVIVEHGGHMECEICGTEMRAVMWPSKIVELNRKIGNEKTRRLIQEARKALYADCGSPGERSPEQEQKMQHLYEVISYLYSLLPKGSKKLGRENERGGFRAYHTAADRRRGHTTLKKAGWNYFVGYHEAGYGEDYPFGLMYGMSEDPYELDVRCDYPKH